MVETGAMDEERRINEEYKLWKKHTPFLYDLLITHSLEWPSLTAQWLPDRTFDNDKGCNVQRLLLGTHTSGEEQNFLVVASVTLPISTKTEQPFDTNGFSSNCARVEVQHRIPHEGEVNRARYMPQRPDIVATKTVSSQLHVFDLSRPCTPSSHSTSDRGETAPLLRLQGHRKEGYGLMFSPKQEGLLASGSDDHLVCIWDVCHALKEGRREAPPLGVCQGHTDVVEDVAWHPAEVNLLATVSDDRTLKVWDYRDLKRAEHSAEAHSAEVNAVQFNPFSQFVLATGSGDRTAALWDMRNLRRRLHSFPCHGEVFSVQWAPFSETVLATSSADRRIAFWDVARIGKELPPEDAQDGPPELLFIHAGHTSKVSDLSWNAQSGDEWVMASVAEDNILQVWRLAEAIYSDAPEVKSEK
eukprot:GGOE01049381.1.p1 GENE.GGOE01049381.1~~GGOE01049381.1.p1  ORF type:complete len:442 (+),score=143.57 GGOE01049381.1:86-1327(+)